MTDLETLSAIAGVPITRVSRQTDADGSRRFIFRFNENGYPFVSLRTNQARSAGALNVWLNQVRRALGVTGPFPLLTTSDARYFAATAHAAAEKRD